MKQIPLTHGKFSLVDDEDYKWLMRWKWYALWMSSIKSFYAVRNSKTKNGKHCLISMAREILGLKHGDKLQADHICHNTLDNRRLNLRAVTHQQNNFNQKNTKGYSWDKHAEKYRARIEFNGKYIHLGLFLTAEDAHNAYLQAKEQYHKINKEIL